MRLVDADRIAEPGLCTCRKRVVRGVDDTGELVVVDVWGADAAAELLAHGAGRQSFYLDLQLKQPRGLVITRRTLTQLKRWPAGFNRRQVVLAHECAQRRGDNA